MRDQMERATGLHQQHSWQLRGPAHECSRCYAEAFSYTTSRVAAYGVSDAWAEDVADEALARAMRSFNPKKARHSGAPFQSFLYIVARSCAYSHLRSERQRRLRGEQWQIGQARLLTTEQIDNKIAEADLVEHVMEEADRKWGQSKPGVARVCRLWLSGLTEAQIASEVGIDRRTVRRHRQEINVWLQRKYRY